MSQALTTVFAQVKTLSMEDQCALNKLLVANISLGQKAVMTSANFKTGNIVKFNSKTRGPIFIKINGFSRDRSKVKGVQLNQGWKTHPGAQWTVAAPIIRASTVAEAETNKF